MTVKRVVPNIHFDDPSTAKAFYSGIFDLDLVMDHGWITTFAEPGESAMPQLSVASEGGSGTPVPAMSIEVDDLEKVLQRVRAAGIAIEYGPAVEPWGVRRFYIRDPAGTLLNVLQHI